MKFPMPASELWDNYIATAHRYKVMPSSADVIDQSAGTLAAELYEWAQEKAYAAHRAFKDAHDDSEIWTDLCARVRRARWIVINCDCD